MRITEVEPILLVIPFDGGSSGERHFSNHPAIHPIVHALTPP